MEINFAGLEYRHAMSILDWPLAYSLLTVLKAVGVARDNMDDEAVEAMSILMENNPKLCWKHMIQVQYYLAQAINDGVYELGMRTS